MIEPPRRGALAGPRRALARTTAVLDLVLEGVTSLGLAAIVAINTSELVARNLVNHSFVWGYEINLLLANWVYFLGICLVYHRNCLLYTSPSPRDRQKSRMPSSA